MSKVTTPSKKVFMFARYFAAVMCAIVLVAGNAVFAESPIELFNGKDLSGWKGSDNWSVQDGAITGKSTSENPLKNNIFLIWDGTVENFELTLEYKIQGGNSGIQYRSKVIDADKFIVGGYQADIDSSKRFTGINYEERGRGILAERGQVVTISEKGEKAVAKELGTADELIKKVSDTDWNRYKIVAKGNTLQHFINDTLMSETQDSDPSKAAKSGVLAFQLHAGPPMTVQFKNVKLTKIP